MKDIEFALEMRERKEDADTAARRRVRQTTSLYARTLPYVVAVADDEVASCGALVVLQVLADDAHRRVVSNGVVRANDCRAPTSVPRPDHRTVQQPRPLAYGRRSDDRVVSVEHNVSVQRGFCAHDAERPNGDAGHQHG